MLVVGWVEVVRRRVAFQPLDADAPGMATTLAGRTSQASAIWLGAAACASATCRKTSSSPPAREIPRWDIGLNRRTLLVGRL
jgi:hypothetical protein